MKIMKIVIQPEELSYDRLGKSCGCGEIENRGLVGNSYCKGDSFQMANDGDDLGEVGDWILRFFRYSRWTSR